MPDIPRLCATVLVGSALMAGSPSFTQQTQSQPTSNQQNNQGTGSRSNGSKKAPPKKADDADKLTPDRMSTRGLHRQAKSADEKTTKPDQQSTTKPAPDK